MDNILLTALYPHPPIIVPEVGGGEAVKVKNTIQAVESLSKKIVEMNPETIVIITPHSLINYSYFSAYTDEKLKGNFSKFGAPDTRVIFKNDLEFVQTIEDMQKELFRKVNKIPTTTPLDHGSCVPLYFLAKAGFKGQIAVFNYSGLDAEEHIFFGDLINKTAAKLGRKTVVIASGDLSHKLAPTAPAGYLPEAKAYDEFIAENITKGDYEAIINIDPELRKTAGECAHNSLMVAFGAADKQPRYNFVLSYEAPFGVGYLVAML